MPRPSDEEILADVDEQIRQQPPPRCTVLATLRQLVGGDLVSYQNPATRDQYVAAVYFFLIFAILDDGSYDVSAAQKSQAYAMAAGQSSCGLVTEIGWRAAGVALAYLYVFYGTRVAHGQYAVMMEKQGAEGAGAWVSGIPFREADGLPGIGDAVIIGLASDPSFTRGGGFAGEHEFTVVSYLGDTGDGRSTYVHSIDGGQANPSAGGSQSIALRTRALSFVPTGTASDGTRTGELWACQVGKDGSVALDVNGRPIQGRRVVGYSVIDRLPLNAPLPPCVDGGPAQGDAPGGSSGLGGLLGAAAAGAAGLAAFFGARWFLRGLAQIDHDAAVIVILVGERVLPGRSSSCKAGLRCAPGRAEAPTGHPLVRDDRPSLEVRAAGSAAGHGSSRRIGGRRRPDSRILSRLPRASLRISSLQALTNCVTARVAVCPSRTAEESTTPATPGAVGWSGELPGRAFMSVGVLLAAGRTSHARGRGGAAKGGTAVSMVPRILHVSGQAQRAGLTGIVTKCQRPPARVLRGRALQNETR